MLVVGEREGGEGTVSVREHRAGDLGASTVEEFAGRMRGELYSPALDTAQSPEFRD